MGLPFHRGWSFLCVYNVFSVSVGEEFDAEPGQWQLRCTRGWSNGQVPLLCQKFDASPVVWEPQDASALFQLSSKPGKSIPQLGDAPKVRGERSFLIICLSLPSPWDVTVCSEGGQEGQWDVFFCGSV